MLLDEPWLRGLLAPPPSPRLSVPVAPACSPAAVSPAQEGRGPRVDWGEAPDVPRFYGRQREVSTLVQWVVQERCRVVSVLGLGGSGKSALATQVMHQVAEHFEIVLWRSLREAQSFEAWLADCLQVLAPGVLSDGSVSLERRLGLLLECVRRSRILLVLDHLETLLEEGQSTGQLRPGYEGYARLLRQLAQTAHQSCLLLTSREKVGELVALEGMRAPVRALRLVGLDAAACHQLLADREVAGSAAEQGRLIEAYAGNPLALNLIAQSISDLFAGQIAPFLEQGEVVFGAVRKLLDEHYARLTDLEQMVLQGLAQVGEPVTLGELRALLVLPRPWEKLLEAVDRLQQRSLIEQGQRPGSFTLPAVVLEYVTTRLGGEPRDRAGTAGTPDPAWTLPGSRQGGWTADSGAAAGSRAGVFSVYPPGAYSGGRAVPLAARPTA